MAKKYKDLAADLLRQGRNVTMDLANSTIDFVADLPVRTADHAERVRSNMTSKAEVVATTIEAKILLEDRLMGEIDDAEFAYRMVQDDNLRKTVKLLTQQILDSDPKRIEPKADGSFLNFGAGVSTFWEELQRKTPIERENAVEIEQVLLNLESGFDEDIAPDTRKLFLREAGLTPEQVDDFVPLSEYIIYETKMMDQVRDQVRADLDMGTDKPLSEAEQLVVDAVSEDRMYAGNKPVRDGYIRGKYEGQSVDIKGSWSSHTFTDEEAAKLFAGETIDFDYTKKDGQSGHVSGKLEWQSYKGKEFLGFNADFSKKQAPKQEQPSDGFVPLQFEQGNPFERQSTDKVPADIKSVRDGYLRGEFEGQRVNIKGSWASHTFTDEEAAKLFAGETIDFDFTKKNGQIGHASGGLEWQSYNGKTFLGFHADLKPVQDGYLRGKYEGKHVDIKGSWASHTFTDEEAAKLFAGETIEFDYTKRNGQIGHVSGKLEWQSYNGKDFLGFNADFSKKQAPKQEQPLEAVSPSSVPSETVLTGPPSYDALSYEETYGLSAQDMYTLFSNGDGHIPDPETWTDAPIDDQEWQQIMEMSGAEENYQAMLNGSIEENMAMLVDLEAKEQVQEKGLALEPDELPFPPQEMYTEAPPMMGISDADLAFAEQYAHEMDDSFGISDADLAFAAQFDQPQQ